MTNKERKLKQLYREWSKNQKQAFVSKKAKTQNKYFDRAEKISERICAIELK